MMNKFFTLFSIAIYGIILHVPICPTTQPMYLPIDHPTDHTIAHLKFQLRRLHRLPFNEPLYMCIPPPKHPLLIPSIFPSKSPFITAHQDKQKLSEYFDSQKSLSKVTIWPNHFALFTDGHQVVSVVVCEGRTRLSDVLAEAARVLGISDQDYWVAAGGQRMDNECIIDGSFLFRGLARKKMPMLTIVRKSKILVLMNLDTKHTLQAVVDRNAMVVEEWRKAFRASLVQSGISSKISKALPVCSTADGREMSAHDQVYTNSDDDVFVVPVRHVNVVCANKNVLAVPVCDHTTCIQLKHRMQVILRADPFELFEDEKKTRVVTDLFPFIYNECAEPKRIYMGSLREEGLANRRSETRHHTVFILPLVSIAMFIFIYYHFSKND